MLREFLDWWLGQLKDLLPAKLKSQLRRELCLLYLDVRRDEVEVRANFHGKQYPFGNLEVNSDNDLRQLELQEFITSLPQPPDRILVRISQGRYLSREIDLPLAAEDNIADTVRFQIEQLTPFSADQVLCFSGIKERLPAEKKLKVWMAVTPTEQVDEALQLLGGPPPTPMQMPRTQPEAGEPLEIVFRPFGRRSGSSMDSFIGMAVIFILLFTSVFSFHVYNRTQTRDHLQQQLHQARDQATQAVSIKKAIQQMREQSQQLSQKKSGSTSFIGLWDDLTQRLDDNTWLQRIDLQGSKITLQGISSNSSQLIEQLEASPYLSDVRFASSVTRDKRSEADRFNLSATLQSTLVKQGGKT